MCVCDTEGTQREIERERRVRDKKVQKKEEREREEMRESNTKERREWTETRETTKRAAKLNCNMGPTILVFTFPFLYSGFSFPYFVFSSPFSFPPLFTS